MWSAGCVMAELLLGQEHVWPFLSVGMNPMRCWTFSKMLMLQYFYIIYHLLKIVSVEYIQQGGSLNSSHFGDLIGKCKPDLNRTPLENMAKSGSLHEKEELKYCNVNIEGQPSVVDDLLKFRDEFETKGSRGKRVNSNNKDVFVEGTSRQDEA
uniref:Uncharacterized protein n=1 Tax=Nelumbo nucifera TaxID=4432 RepID=A0A822YIT8_NELNU|nr:TPA_asm: hypothetical protein HUJ06_011298 [Nelumbo nucifera]